MQRIKSLIYLIVLTYKIIKKYFFDKLHFVLFATALHQYSDELCMLF